MTTMTKKTTPRYVQVPAYKFDELEDHAKNRVREWLREGDTDWWESTFDDFTHVAECFGFTVKVHTRNVLGPHPHTERYPRIHFNNGCWTAGFDALWSLLDAVHAGKQIREYLNDELLHKLADALESEIARFVVSGLEPLMREGGVYADINGNEHGIANDCGELVWGVLDELEDLNEIQTAAAHSLSERVRETAVDLARWLAKRLEMEDKYRSSDECVRETCEANEYLFDEDGRIL